MKKIKVTFSNGHTINYKGNTDDDLLWSLISKYHSSKGGEFFANTGYMSGLTYEIEQQ